jgi:hypothetical protein
MDKGITPVSWLIDQILELPLDEGTNAVHLKKHVNKVTVFNHALQMEANKQKKYDKMLEMLESICSKYETDHHLLNVSPSKIKQLVKEANNEQ